MLAAGLLAKKAVERGLDAQAVGEDLAGAGLEGGHRLLPRVRGSRPTSTRSASTSSATAAPPASATRGRCRTEIADAIHRENLVACSVLSGNRNFEGRINSDVRANYLMSPPLVVAFALAGRIDVDLSTEPLGTGQRRAARSSCATSGRSGAEIEEVLQSPPSSPTCSGRATRRCSRATSAGSALEVPEGDRFAWDADLHLRAAAAVLRRHGQRQPPERVADDLAALRVIAMLGDSVTTDHISPAGSIKKDSPAGAVPRRAGRGARPTSTPTARGAATTR